jgi:hypothetical protein
VYRRPVTARRWAFGFAPPLRRLARCQLMGDAAAWGRGQLNQLSSALASLATEERGGDRQA